MGDQETIVFRFLIILNRLDCIPKLFFYQLFLLPLLFSIPYGILKILSRIFLILSNDEIQLFYLFNLRHGKNILKILFFNFHYFAKIHH